MADSSTPPVKTPWHVWAIGTVSLLWNTVGAFDFTMTQMRNEAYLKAFTPEQRDYFYNFPKWVIVAWGIATWGSVLGSALLLTRRNLAYQVFAASFVGMLLTMVHNYVLTDGLKLMGGGFGQVVFTGVINLIAFLLLVYAWAMRRRDVLH